ncbi:MAG TPA: hypothetical protein VEI45_11240 [Mycobacterium sp.]|uniref:hypothetical protein n=1 Tax=Mycobacterium sp. TaxID=1785 RepID=UPI002D4AB63E|nr:hypothetical protein [Mycobacterium sp.]HXY64896.1 hypothetical protein [Mycobacterium sp.]
MPFFPAIWVEVGAAAALVDGSAIADDTADDAEEAAELAACPALVAWWQPTPISANAAIPTENVAVLFVIARISSSRIPFELD